jgi:ATP-dependent Clp protease ATP-binding subunit ClpA
MFEKFDEGGRQAILLAHAKADETRAVGIEPVHLLIGVALSTYVTKTGKPATVGGLVLKTMGLRDKQTIRQVLSDAQVKSKPVTIGGQFEEEEVEGTTPITKDARKALELALRESLSMGHTEIRAEHILLGVMRLQDETVNRALAGLVRHNVIAQLIYENHRKKAS